ncbi:MAG: hypothetical protein FWD28_04300 [Treponema sp.]|nr:hypothetical protein [Treponema sp.]
MNELDLHWVDDDPDLFIEPEGVYCKDIDEIIKRITEVKDTVTKINLDNQHSLKEIPVILSECTLLEDLNISHTEITEIPDFLFTLPALRSLSCCCSKLSGFPRGLLKAQNLEYLHIRINIKWVIPEELASLKNLKTVIFDLYSDSALPKKLGTLPNLEDFSIYIKYDEGSVPLIPDSFNNHPSLKKISIHEPFLRNRKTLNLEHTLKTLSSCKKLESLKLGGFIINNEHQKLSKLINLKELELRHLIADGDIFKSITGLQNLEKLCIWGSEQKITALPDIFSNFPNLHLFSFAGNFITELPHSFYKLEKLTSIEIGSTGISVIDNNIGNLKNLESVHLYDNMLSALPDTIFDLPNLTVLNIEENLFKQKESQEIKQKIKELSGSGKKIELLDERQGHRYMVKKLRTLKNITEMDPFIYYKHCLDAVNENPFSLKYADKEKLNGTNYYAELCIGAVRKNCFVLEIIDPKMLTKSHYFHICLEAAKSRESRHIFKLINETLLTDDEYIQVCLEAALHNKSEDFLVYLNKGSFMYRFGRTIYERICWAAVLHYPPVIKNMIEPTKEIYDIVEKRIKNKNNS